MMQQRFLYFYSFQTCTVFNYSKLFIVILKLFFCDLHFCTRVVEIATLHFLVLNINILHMFHYYSYS